MKEKDIDLAGLLELIINTQVDLFDLVDQSLQQELDMPLIALLPLRVISRNPMCRVQEIADELSISVGGASKSIDRLERRGWCKRVENPEDRRSSGLTLTRLGKQILDQGNAIVERHIRLHVVEPLGEQTEQFFQSLTKLHTANHGTHIIYK